MASCWAIVSGWSLRLRRRLWSASVSVSAKPAPRPWSWDQCGLPRHTWQRVRHTPAVTVEAGLVPHGHDEFGLVVFTAAVHWLERAHDAGHDLFVGHAARMLPTVRGVRVGTNPAPSAMPGAAGLAAQPAARGLRPPSSSRVPSRYRRHPTRRHATDLPTRAYRRTSTVWRGWHGCQSSAGSAGHRKRSIKTHRTARRASARTGRGWRPG